MPLDVLQSPFLIFWWQLYCIYFRLQPDKCFCWQAVSENLPKTFLFLSEYIWCSQVCWPIVHIDIFRHICIYVFGLDMIKKGVCVCKTQLYFVVVVILCSGSVTGKLAENSLLCTRLSICWAWTRTWSHTKNIWEVAHCLPSACRPTRPCMVTRSLHQLDRSASNWNLRTRWRRPQTWCCSPSMMPLVLVGRNQLLWHQTSDPSMHPGRWKTGCGLDSRQIDEICLDNWPDGILFYSPWVPKIYLKQQEKSNEHFDEK